MQIWPAGNIDRFAGADPFHAIATGVKVRGLPSFRLPCHPAGLHSALLDSCLRRNISLNRDGPRMQALPADESLPRFPTRTMLLSRYPMAIYVRPLFCWLLVALGGGAVWSVSAPRPPTRDRMRHKH